MGRRRQLTKQEKQLEGRWLKAILDSRNLLNKDLAEEIGIDNPTNVSHWCSGKSAIPDLDLLWIGHRFNEDVFSLRPALLDYAIYFEGDSILSGLREDERKTVTDLIEMIRQRKRPYFDDIKNKQKGVA